MGWGRCGKNEKTGKMMGYMYSGVCAERGCKEKIDHGLGYVCGGMHEGGDHGCGRYMCGVHLTSAQMFDGQVVQVCHRCKADIDSALVDDRHEELKQITANLDALNQLRPGSVIRGDRFKATFYNPDNGIGYWSVEQVPTLGKYCQAEFGDLYFRPVLEAAIKGGAVVEHPAPVLHTEEG